MLSKKWGGLHGEGVRAFYPGREDSSPDKAVAGQATASLRQQGERKLTVCGLDNIYVLSVSRHDYRVVVLTHLSHRVGLSDGHVL